MATATIQAAERRAQAAGSISQHNDTCKMARRSTATRGELIWQQMQQPCAGSNTNRACYMDHRSSWVVPPDAPCIPRCSRSHLSFTLCHVPHARIRSHARVFLLAFLGLLIH